MKRNVLAALPALALALTACGSDTSAVTSLTGDAAAGKALYTTNCAGCHGADGTSGPARHDVVGHCKTEPEEAIAVILDGDDEMPGFATTLTSQQVADIVAYIRSL
jgi:mono/diheme cytochrome c family protein